jgi:hypothetical protein
VESPQYYLMFVKINSFDSTENLNPSWFLDIKGILYLY